MENQIAGPFQIVKKTVLFYRENFLDCLLFGVLSQAVSIIGTALSPLNQLSVAPDPSLEWFSDNLGQVITIGFASVAWIVLNLWVYLLIAGAISKLVWKRNRKEEVPVFSSYLLAFDQGGPLLWANILTAFVIGGATLFAAILFAMETQILQKGTILQLLLSLLSLSAMGGVVFLCLKFSLVTPVVLLEGSRGPDSLKRSWDLMSGNEWQAFILFVGFFAFLIFLGVITGLAQGEAENLSDPAFSSRQLFEGFIGIFVAPIFPIGITQFYQEILDSKKNIL
jgi:hypothetical protein